MIRKIIHIDEEKCNGCGACANACHEGAIDIVNGKAKLVRENFCDGFGDCLPNCPMGAITFEEREAPAYDEDAVLKAKEEKKCANETLSALNSNREAHAGGCPGSRVKVMSHRNDNSAENVKPNDGVPFTPVSRLSQWPVQIKLVPTKADFYNNAKLLIAADCTAYAYANMHEDFIKGKITLVGCPKLDDIDYSEKLTQIIANNNIQSVTIVRMEVPCCGGLQMAAQRALQASGKFIPWQVVTISIDGKILD